MAVLMIVMMEFDGIADGRGCAGVGEDVNAGFGAGFEGEEGTDSNGYLDVGCHDRCR